MGNLETLFSDDHVTEITLLVAVRCSVTKIVENLAYRIDLGIVRRWLLFYLSWLSLLPRRL
jgi:hypothetical protein